MGQINAIKKDKKTKAQNRKFMVSLTFDLWASNHEEACWKLADYLEMVLTDKMDKSRFIDYANPPYKPIIVEATELDQKSTYNTLDSGHEFGVK